MIARKIVSRYIQALLDIAVENDNVEKIQGELQSISKAFSESSDLRSFLLHPRISSLRKKRLIDDIFSTTLSPVVLKFLKHLINKKREEIIVVACEEFKIATDKLHGIIKAQVRSATRLTDLQMHSLKAALEKQIKKTVELQIEIDDSILGGLQVLFDSSFLDGSITGRINRLQKHLLETELP